VPGRKEETTKQPTNREVQGKMNCLKTIDLKSTATTQMFKISLTNSLKLNT